ncbi:Peptidase A4 family protein [compost metagenome]
MTKTMNASNKRSFTRPCLADKSYLQSAKKEGFGWVSGNWSGYALSGTKGAYRRICGEWTVPFIMRTPNSTYSSAWIGIDGFQNSSLIQTGTGHECVGGVIRYYAWWEILPAEETVIGQPVYPGDRMRAVIVKQCKGKWSISLRNLTRGWTFRTIRHYSGPQSSAEWIVEAPQVGGRASQLAWFSPVSFRRCRVNGKNPRLSPADGGIMIQDRKAAAVPSSPSRSGDAFSVKRKLRTGCFPM